MKDFDADGCFTAISAVVIVIVLLIFGGAIGWVSGYICGWLLKLIIGTPVAKGLTLILGNICNHDFTPADIPYVTATLGLIGGYFKARLTTKKNED